MTFLSLLYQRKYTRFIFPVVAWVIFIRIFYSLTVYLFPSQPDLCRLLKEKDGSKNITRQWWEWTCLLEQEWDKDLDYNCGDLRRVANYYICFDEPYTPKPPCLVYSFGIANDFRFDDAMARLGCEVYSFDPSMHVPDHRRSERVQFHSIGISTVDSDSFVPFEDDYTRGINMTWRIRTLPSLKRMLGHENRKLDILKLDVETYEWKIMKHLLSDGSLHSIKQLAIEWHIFTTEPPHVEHQDMFLTYVQLKKIGFKPFHVDSGARYHSSHYFNSQTDNSLVNTLFQ